MKNLLASLQGKSFTPKLVIFSELGVQHHIAKLDMQRYEPEIICYPITRDKLLAHIVEPMTDNLS